jgi:hypothetical protein
MKLVLVMVGAFQKSFPVHNTRDKIKKSIFKRKGEEEKTFLCCPCMRGCKKDH